MNHTLVSVFALALNLLITTDAAALAPQVVETRTVKLTQTVTLDDIPEGCRQLRLWVPIPSDGPWQRVLDARVVSAPGRWQVLGQSEGRGEFVYAEVNDPAPGSASVVFECTVQRQGVHFALDGGAPAAGIQPELFAQELDTAEPLMESGDHIRKLADAACGDERDVARQAVLLMRSVADSADHYSKDATKPKCGIGSADNCLMQGGGCCTDLHSLFIALARARGIPARIQFGYRLLDAKAGGSYDPGYRCWVEVFVPGQGWVPNDIVASDGAATADAHTWGSLSATRVSLWRGRNFELNPPAAAGPVNVMFGGWAELDGKPVDTLPAPDGTPSRLGRTVQFQVLRTDRTSSTPKLPE
jgi:hypothetical protein